MDNRTLLYLLKQQFDRSFHDWDKNQPARTGLHASSVLESESDFCTRQHVIAEKFPETREAKDQYLPSLQKFVNGWALHKKWQEDLIGPSGLVKMGVVIREQEGLRITTQRPELDLTHIDPETGVHFSPDIILSFAGLTIPIEIKGINTLDFQGCPDLYLESGEMYEEARPGIIGATLQEAAARNKSIRSAIPQINLYLHLLGLTTPPNNRGIILVEDKNTQEFELFVHEYDPELAIMPVQRAFQVRNSNEHFDFNDGELPERNYLCTSVNSSRAKRCPFRTKCFTERG